MEFMHLQQGSDTFNTTILAHLFTRISAEKTAPI